MRRIKVKPKFYIIILCLLAAVLLTVLGVKLIKQAIEKANQPAPIDPVKPKAAVTVTVNYDASILSENTAVTEALETFVKNQYTAIANLENSDMKPSFTSPEGEQAWRNQAALQLLIDIRLGQKTDLTMKSMDCSLLVTKVSVSEKTVSLEALESSECRFNCSANTASKVGDVKVSFTLDSSSGEMKIASYDRNDEFFQMIDALYQGGTAGQNGVETAMLAVKENCLSKVKENIKRMDSSLAEYLAGKAETYAAAQNPYKRADALEYASTYALSRNPQFLDFTTLGGNCQNYASQILRAGGIPNDMDGEEKWKYYSDAYDITGQAKGRTPSWTSVTGFLDYAQKNTGYGLSAAVGANIFTLEGGDLIICTDIRGEKVHTLAAASLIYDEAGNAADILTFSSSINRKNYPLRAYCYCDYTGIKILGWNE